jgi:hypothetical protein
MSMLQFIGNHYFSSIACRQSRNPTSISFIKAVRHYQYKYQSSLVESLTSKQYYSLSTVIDINNKNNNICNMKFTTNNNGVAALLLLISRTTAWTTTQPSIAIARSISENNNRRAFYNKASSSSSVLSSSTVSISDVSTESSGKEQTESFRLFFKDTSKSTISPWHDIPFKNDDGTYNMVRI